MCVCVCVCEGECEGVCVWIKGNVIQQNGGWSPK